MKEIDYKIEALRNMLIELQQQLKNCNLQNVSNNEVSVCEKCQHYRKDNTPEICRRCFSNSHFQKAN